MKKIVTILILVFAITLTTQAQKNTGKNPVDRMLKKMTKNLDLSEAQQNEIKPLLETQFAERKAMKNNTEKPTKEIRKKRREDRLISKTAFDTKMSNILTEDQYAKYEALENERKEKAKARKKKN